MHCLSNKTMEHKIKCMIKLYNIMHTITHLDFEIARLFSLYSLWTVLWASTRILWAWICTALQDLVASSASISCHKYWHSWKLDWLCRCKHIVYKLADNRQKTLFSKNMKPNLLSNMWHNYLSKKKNCSSDTNDDTASRQHINKQSNFWTRSVVTLSAAAF